MNFGTNKTTTEVIKEGSFGSTYFRDIYLTLKIDTYFKNSWKAFNSLKNTDPQYHSSSFYDIKINKYGIKCKTSLRFWENKRWILANDPYGWFQWYFRYYLGRRGSGNERQIKRWKRIVTRFKGILVKMIKNKGAKFDDYSISPKIRHILLHWGYELVESDLF